MNYNQTTANISFNIEKSPDHAVFALIKKNDFDAIKQLHLSLADLDAKNQQYQSVTQFAAVLHAQNILDHFYQIALDFFTFEDKLDIKKQDNKGRTIVHWAAKCNQAESVFQRFQEQGIELDQADNSYKVTPLYLAIQDQCKRAIVVLIQLGADVNHAVINGGTPLHAASECGDTAIIQQLIVAGANINHQCQQGATPLFVAAQKGHVDAVNCLMQAGADKEIRFAGGATPLLIAMQQGHVEVARALLAAGAKTDYHLPNGWTLAQFAKELKNDDLLKLF